MEKTTKEVLQTEWIVKYGYGKIFIDSDKWQVCDLGTSNETNQANAELICKAVNERQNLIDSNKELLKLLNELHHFAVNNCKAYKTIHHTLHFETVNIMANGLHNKFE